MKTKEYLQFKILFFVFISLLYTQIIQGQRRPNEIGINNGVIKLKLDLTSGGAISYLSDARNSYNVVNVHDKGRYIQQSYYNGQSLNRRSEGQHPNYSPWNWNPVQAGDVYRKKSKVITYYKRSNELYVKNRPLLWDMNNEPCECYFETWVTLEGNVAHVRNKLTSSRTDNLWQTRAVHQELPAVYTRGDLYKLYTYKGSKPWTNGNLTRITKTGPPWEYWNTKENWAALVNNRNWGVGVYNPISTLFVGGFSGSPGGGPTNGSTGYFSPLITKALPKRGTFEYKYDLILGNLRDIRNYVYKKKGVGSGGGGNKTLAWEFNKAGNTEGWRKSGGTGSVSVSGGKLKVVTSSADPQIIRNVSFNPSTYSFLKIGMKNFTNNTDMDFFWSNSSGGFSGSKRIRASVTQNSNQREYVFDLRNVSLWKNGGKINAIRIDPPGNGSPRNEYVEIDYIRFTSNARYSVAKEENLKFDVSNVIFPNPFTDRLYIKTKDKNIILYDSKGKAVDISKMEKTVDGFNLNTEELSSGIYFLKIGNETYQVYK